MAQCSLAGGALGQFNDPMSQKQTLVIVGASTRAAAFSALRAGFEPFCIDLFADADLMARCPVKQIDHANYPQGLRVELPNAPLGPWMYTGGIENHPRLVDDLASQRRLWGNGAKELRLVRDPNHLATLLRGWEILHPNVSLEPPPSSGSERWLVKPIAGAGGSSVKLWHSGMVHRRGTYYQQFIDGESYSALFVSEPWRAHLIGVSRQLIGQSWLNARPFAYCGSIGPIELGSKAREVLHRIGQAVSRSAGLRGLWGVDFILHEDIPIPVEVNPRYTASLEVMEFAHGLPYLLEHAAAFDPGLPPLAAFPSCGPVIGKAILFAGESFSFPADGPWRSLLALDRPLTLMPEFADIPRPGTVIQQGWPIMTLFAKGNDAEEVEQNLRRKAEKLQQFLGTTSSAM